MCFLQHTDTHWIYLKVHSLALLLWLPAAGTGAEGLQCRQQSGGRSVPLCRVLHAEPRAPCVELISRDGAAHSGRECHLGEVQGRVVTGVGVQDGVVSDPVCLTLYASRAVSDANTLCC